jgi:hypothetical protein
MSTKSVAVSPERPKAYQAILWGTLIAGTLDIMSAVVHSTILGGGPVRMLKSIASGLLGPSAFEGGFGTAALGLALHFLIAFTAVAVFYLASRKLKFMVRQPVVSGVLYGIAVYLFMYGVVLPLTFHRNFFTQFTAVLISVLIHIFFVGLPISLTIRRFSPLLLLLLLIILPWSAHNTPAATSREAIAAAATPAVLVELFTSEGCSSCPPADRVLASLDETQPVKGVQVIALSQHVDYWNQFGWKDPFSSAEFSRRQIEYMRVLGTKDVYTPQMIVDGQAEFVGSNLGAAREAITKAARSPKADVSLTIKALTPNSLALAVQAENIPEVSRDDKADVMLAVTEGGLLSKVSRGENSGRDLAHSAVTRKLIKIGTVAGGTFGGEPRVDLSPTWKRQNMKAVVFVQERASRRVLGAAAIKFLSES